MNSSDLLESVEDANGTALSRLGSSKALFAVTAGDMDDESVLTAAADGASVVRQTVADWTDETDGPVATVVETEADRYERIVQHLDDHDPGGDPLEIGATLASFETTVDRLGGLLGWVIVASKTTDQYTGYFVGQANPQTANVFRDLSGELEQEREVLLDGLDGVCTDDAEWERAREAATVVIQAAYEAYTETLESLGVNPKPVC
jgi:hypothetical protein